MQALFARAATRITGTLAHPYVWLAHLVAAVVAQRFVSEGELTYWLSVEAILIGLLVLNVANRFGLAQEIELADLARAVPGASNEIAAEHLEDEPQDALEKKRAELDRKAGGG